MTVGDRSGYLVRQWVGEDGAKGAPTLIVSVGEGRRAEAMFGPACAEEFAGAEAVGNEPRKIAGGLTAVG